MEKSFIQNLKHLNDSIVEMGNLCEESIVNATKRLITGDEIFEQRAIALEKQIDASERYIQMLCIKLLLKNPVNDDLKMINTDCFPFLAKKYLTKLRTQLTMSALQSTVVNQLLCSGKTAQVNLQF